MTETAALTRRSRWWRWLKRAFWVFNILIFLLLLWIGIDWFINVRPVELELEKIRARGEPVSAADMHRLYGSEPLTKDSTEVWQKAIVGLMQIQIPRSAYDFPLSPTGQAWPEEDEIVIFLRAQSDVLQRLHSAAQNGGEARFPLEFEKGGFLIFPHLEEVRSGVLLVLLEARFFAHRGNWESTQNSLNTAFGLKKSIRNEPLLLPLLTCCAVDLMIWETISGSIGIENFSESQLRELQVEARNHQYENLLHRALLGERQFVLWSYEPPVSAATRLLWKFKTAGGFLRYLKAMEMVLQDSPKNWKRTEEDFRRARHIVGDRKLSSLFTDVIHPSSSGVAKHLLKSMFKEIDIATISFSHLEGCVRKVFFTIASLRAADAAIAVELYRRKNGNLPDNISMLVPEFFDQLPADPFSEEELKYKTFENGFMVYSVGKDGHDDAGKESSGDNPEAFPYDIVFKVDYRF